MLSKMSRSMQKDQNLGNQASSQNGYESDFMGPKQKTNSFFSIPGLFVGLNPKGLSDCDSVNSPTSPLDFRVFSNLTNPFRSPKSSTNPFGSPKSSHNGNHKRFKGSKVGLSIIDSLIDDVEDDGTKGSGRGHVNRPLDCKNIVVGSQMRFKSSNFGNPFVFLEKPSSLPKNYGTSTSAQIKSSNLRKEQVSDSLFEIGEDPFEHESIGSVLSCSLDSGMRSSTCNSFDYLNNTKVNSPQSIGKSSNFDRFFPANTSSNSVFTGSSHAFIGRPSVSEMDLSDDHRRLFHCSEISGSFRSVNFLSFCYSCKKNLDGEDIYMYRGEKAFCSLSCREQEILIDRELEDEDTLDDLPATTLADDQDG